jgi:hypothetical protein
MERCLATWLTRVYDVHCEQDTRRSRQAQRFLGILLGLNSSGKPIYAGTVPSADVAKRRAKNRLARKARRINR